MASQSTMGKLHDMRLSVMARAYRDQEEVPLAGEMSFDERLAMIVDAEWDSRRTNKRLRCLRQANFGLATLYGTLSRGIEIHEKGSSGMA